MISAARSCAVLPALLVALAACSKGGGNSGAPAASGPAGVAAKVLTCWQKKDVGCLASHYYGDPQIFSDPARSSNMFKPGSESKFAEVLAWDGAPPDCRLEGADRDGRQSAFCAFQPKQTDEVRSPLDESSQEKGIRIWKRGDAWKFEDLQYKDKERFAALEKVR